MLVIGFKKQHDCKSRKFPAIIVNRNSDMSNQYTLSIDGNQVTSKNSVKLQGINIDDKLSFDEDVPSLYKKQIIN